MPRVAKSTEKPAAVSTSTAVRRKASDDHEAAGSSKRQRLKFTLPLPEMPKVTGNALVCGQGDMGQLGLGEDEMEKKRPTAVSTIKDVVFVCAGGMHNLCLTKAGEVYSFGCNDEGALGRDTSEEGSEFTPAKVALPGKAVQISAGDSHSACLLDDGRVFAWGSFRDSHGNMGLTLQGNKRSPVHLVPDKTHCEIASGADHLVMLTTGGSVYTVGCAEQGQLGRISMRSASGDSRRGKTQILTPDMILMKWKKIDKIWATTYCTFLRVAESDTILGFGLNNYKQLGISKDVQVCSTPVVLDSFKNIEKIAGGQHHTLVLKKDKKVYTIGRHDYGRLGLGELKEDVTELKCVGKLKDIVDVSAGEAQSFAIDSNGKVYAWGMGSSLQLGTGVEDDSIEPAVIESKQTQGKEIIGASGGGQHSIFLVKNDSNNNSTAVVASKAAEPLKAEPVKKGKSKEKEVVPKEEPIKSNGVAVAEEDNETEDKGEEEEQKVTDGDVEMPEKKEEKAAAPAKRGRKKK
ncbi:RCC1 family protein [Megaselia abdita]